MDKSTQERVARLERKAVQLNTQRTWALFYNDGPVAVAEFDATIAHVKGLIARLVECEAVSL